MKERPILFSAPMVRAILDGRKTQTRRVVKRPPACPPGYILDPGGIITAGDTWWAHPEGLRVGYSQRCPYGVPGDRLWVRETWCAADTPTGADYRADAPAGCDTRGWGWKPSIHMPRWASRISLEITGVRVERLKDCSEADARAEGIAKYPDGFHWEPNPVPSDCRLIGRSAQLAYFGLWEEINGGESLDANPWVWVVEFRRAVEADGAVVLVGRSLAEIATGGITV